MQAEFWGVAILRKYLSWSTTGFSTTGSFRMVTKGLGVPNVRFCSKTIQGKTLGQLAVNPAVANLQVLE